TGRQAILIVMKVDASKRAFGYYGWGPPLSHSYDQIPAGWAQFNGVISGETLTFSRRGYMKVSPERNGMRLVHERSDAKGKPEIFLAPVWTLIEASVRK